MSNHDNSNINYIYFHLKRKTTPLILKCRQTFIINLTVLLEYKKTFLHDITLRNKTKTGKILVRFHFSIIHFCN
jgi:hypothetical protein